MLKGLLLYTAVDAERNRWFIGHLTETAKRYGIDLTLEICGEMLPDDKAESFLQYDLCINRTRYFNINALLEEGGVRCFNNRKTVMTANDKWLTYKLCLELDIPVAHTRTADDLPTDYPYVLKSRNGHGGSQVYMIKDPSDLDPIDLREGGGYIAQEVASTVGVDVRVYVLGGSPVMAIKRSSANDFRSNYSLGGKVELFDITDEQLEIINKLQVALACDYVGIDFIPHNGRWILNEIEDAVGARMLYSLSELDVAEEFIKHIRNQI